MFLLVSQQNGPKSINRLHFIQRYFNTVRFVEQLSGIKLTFLIIRVNKFNFVKKLKAW